MQCCIFDVDVNATAENNSVNRVNVDVKCILAMNFASVLFFFFFFSYLGYDILKLRTELESVTCLDFESSYVRLYPQELD